ncbi:MAG: septum formation protein Maf [Bacteroidetes bacterium]|nr:septum formation protein Maf [Bacteroidota bacterium]
MAFRCSICLSSTGLQSEFLVKNSIVLANLSSYNVVLASQSPRRQELLAGLDIPFTVKVIPGLDEIYPKTLKGADVALYLAKQKASAYKHLLDEDMLVITADTIVWCDGKVLEKPVDEMQAKEMLAYLSAKTHTVFTGVCLQSKEKRVTFSVSTEVRFAKLSEDEIDYYIEKYRPMDKAGSYGVQEWIGYVAVEHIDGSFYNVMGLPVQRLYSELKAW